jgi:hypothetical protein
MSVMNGKFHSPFKVGGVPLECSGQERLLDGEIAIPKRSGEMRDRPSRRQAWHSDSMVSPDEVGFDLRERLPLPHNILSKTDLAGQSWGGAACGYRYHRGCGQCIHNPKDEAYHLDYYASAGDSAESGMGRFGNHHLTYRVECIHMNVGELNRNVKANRLPMSDLEVGAIIVLGTWESHVQGEGSQSVGTSGAKVTGVRQDECFLYMPVKC